MRSIPALAHDATYSSSLFWRRQTSKKVPPKHTGMPTLW